MKLTFGAEFLIGEQIVFVGFVIITVRVRLPNRPVLKFG